MDTFDKNTFAALEDKRHTCRHKTELLRLSNLTSSQLGYSINFGQLDNCLVYARYWQRQ